MRITLLGGDTLRTACYFTALSRLEHVSLDVILYGPPQGPERENVPEVVFAGLHRAERKLVDGPWLRPRKAIAQSQFLRLGDSSLVGDAETIDAMERINPEVTVFSGLPAELVPATLTDRFQMLHAHPGRLPRFRGSTTIYWSLLEDQTPACSVIILNSKIDQGPIVTIRDFALPKLSHAAIDKYFDPMIRASTLVTALKEGGHRNDLATNDASLGRDYFVIHPVLKALALRSGQWSREQ